MRIELRNYQLSIPLKTFGIGFGYMKHAVESIDITLYSGTSSVWPTDSKGLQRYVCAIGRNEKRRLQKDFGDAHKTIIFVSDPSRKLVFSGHPGYSGFHTHMNNSVVTRLWWAGRIYLWRSQRRSWWHQSRPIFPVHPGWLAAIFLCQFFPRRNDGFLMHLKIRPTRAWVQILLGFFRQWFRSW